MSEQNQFNPAINSPDDSKKIKDLEDIHAEKSNMISLPLGKSISLIELFLKITGVLYLILTAAGYFQLIVFYSRSI
jgi:hypothetical protein